MNRESLNILLKKAYYQQLSEEERKTLKLWLGENPEISKLGGCLCNTLSGHNFRFLFHFNGFRTGIDRTNGCSDTAWLGKGDIDFRGWTASGFG